MGRDPGRQDTGGGTARPRKGKSEILTAYRCHTDPRPRVEAGRQDLEEPDSKIGGTQEPMPRWSRGGDKRAH